MSQYCRESFYKVPLFWGKNADRSMWLITSSVRWHHCISFLSVLLLILDSFSIEILPGLFTDINSCAWDHSFPPPHSYLYSCLSLHYFSPETFLFPSWVWCFSFVLLDAPSFLLSEPLSEHSNSLNSLCHYTISCMILKTMSVLIAILSSGPA